MTFDYAAMATTARQLLAEFGQTITVTRTTGETIDPVTGAVTPGTDTTYSPKGVLRPFPNNLIDETRITTSDRELILDDTVEPQMGDVVTVGGENWNIQSIIGTKPAGVDLVWRVQVGR